MLNSDTSGVSVDSRMVHPTQLGLTIDAAADGRASMIGGLDPEHATLEE